MTGLLLLGLLTATPDEAFDAGRYADYLTAIEPTLDPGEASLRQLVQIAVADGGEILLEGQIPDDWRIGYSGALSPGLNHVDGTCLGVRWGTATRAVDGGLVADAYADGFVVLQACGESSTLPNLIVDALAAVGEAAALSPWMLSDRGYLRAVHDVARVRGDAAEILSASKLWFVMCDYTKEAIGEATEAVSRSLAEAGPGPVMQWARAQEEGGPNPLADVPLLETAALDTMLAAAGDSLDGRINAFLSAGRVAEALVDAKEQLRRSAGQPSWKVAKALRDLARCFKAHDLNLLRANAFLEFHGSGASDNPLPAFEDELEEAAP